MAQNIYDVSPGHGEYPSQDVLLSLKQRLLQCKLSTCPKGLYAIELLAEMPEGVAVDRS